MILEQDLHLDVPFSQKSQAKSKGAKPLYQDGKFKCWIVSAGTDIDPFMDWWPSTMRVQLGGEPDPNPKEVGISLYSYLTKIQRAVASSCLASEWVIAEITNITGNHHKYFELTDYDANGSEKAKVRAALWASKKRIMDNFAEQAGMPLAKNMKVLMKVRAEYDPKYGMSLQIEDVDASFSIGEMEAKLNRIRKQLVDNGEYRLNKQYLPPNDFFKVAVISPEGAAGLGDFLTQAQILEQYRLCSFDYFYATFQGNNAIPTLVGALQSVSAHQANNGFEYDCVCVIRGGGDKAGIYALNEYAIAKAVTAMIIPVITGIGHERDSTILDEVASVSLPTPSMVVGYLVSAITHQSRKTEDLKNKLISASEGIVSRSESELEQLMLKMGSGSERILAKAQSELDMDKQKLFSLANQKVNDAENEAKELYRRLMVNNPMAVLERGYAVIKQNGTVVGSGSELKPGDAEIKMKDGVRSVSIQD